ncbi:Rnase Y domain-containing protein [Dactylosporangium cerinum]
MLQGDCGINCRGCEERSRNYKKEALLEAKEENHRLRTEIENELRGRRTETQKAENRLLQREENLDRKILL